MWTLPSAPSSRSVPSSPTRCQHSLSLGPSAPGTPLGGTDENRDRNGNRKKSRRHRAIGHGIGASVCRMGLNADTLVVSPPSCFNRPSSSWLPIFRAALPTPSSWHGAATSQGTRRVLSSATREEVTQEPYRGCQPGTPPGGASALQRPVPHRHPDACPSPAPVWTHISLVRTLVGRSQWAARWAGSGG